MSTLDDAYAAAYKRAGSRRGLPMVALSSAQQELVRETISAFLSYLADNPPEEMLEALEDPVPYAPGWVDGSPRPWREWQAEAALRSIGADK